jgi:hypothetical protein
VTTRSDAFLQMCARVICCLAWSVCFILVCLSPSMSLLLCDMCRSTGKGALAYIIFLFTPCSYCSSSRSASERSYLHSNVVLSGRKTSSEQRNLVACFLLSNRKEAMALLRRLWRRTWAAVWPTHLVWKPPFLQQNAATFTRPQGSKPSLALGPLPG